MRISLLRKIFIIYTNAQKLHCSIFFYMDRRVNKFGAFRLDRGVNRPGPKCLWAEMSVYPLDESAIVRLADMPTFPGPTAPV